MTRQWVKQLLRLYPSDWRSRYGEEFEALLEQRSLGLGGAADVLRGALGARLHALASPRSSSLAPPSIAVLLWWLALGVLLGVGFVAVPSLGPSLLLLDMLLIAGSAFALGPAGVWAAGIGLGLWPSLILVHTIMTAAPPCQATTVSSACASVPPSYGVVAAILALIPLVGLVAGVWVQARGRHVPAPKSEVRS